MKKMCPDCKKELGSNPASCHKCAMVGPIDDDEERFLFADNTSSIIAHDITCECGTHNLCPIHNEEP